MTPLSHPFPFSTNFSLRLCGHSHGCLNIQQNNLHLLKSEIVYLGKGAEFHEIDESDAQKLRLGRMRTAFESYKAIDKENLAELGQLIRKG